jgi:hypothetical protein
MHKISLWFWAVIIWATTFALYEAVKRRLDHWLHTRRARRIAAEDENFDHFGLTAKKVLHAGVNAVRVGDDLVEVSAVDADGLPIDKLLRFHDLKPARMLFDAAHAKTTVAHSGLFERLAQNDSASSEDGFTTAAQPYYCPVCFTMFYFPDGVERDHKCGHADGNFRRLVPVPEEAPALLDTPVGDQHGGQPCDQ